MIYVTAVITVRAAVIENDLTNSTLISNSFRCPLLAFQCHFSVPLIGLKVFISKACFRSRERIEVQYWTSYTAKYIQTLWSWMVYQTESPNCTLCSGWGTKEQTLYSCNISRTAWSTNNHNLEVPHSGY